MGRAGRESSQRPHPVHGVSLVRPRALPIAGVLVMAATLARAQTTTADGVDAFVQGDYQRAAEILKPIAESWSPRDPVAEFFMATLYESGRGVPADPIRACALYILASPVGSPDTRTPFGRQADGLRQVLQESLSRDEFEDCVELANVGFYHAFQPVTFTLGPGHWISLDLRGATIAYDGTEKRIDLGLATSGVVFLPVEHTELDVGPARSAGRHFIEFFTWIPGQKAQTWTLLWRVFEVVRDGLIEITVAELGTISAERPPVGPFLDVHAMARLRVNDSGEAEWAVLSGPNQGSEVIESEAEKRERDEQVRARRAAEAGVDWTRVRDGQRAPTLMYSDADGCANLFVYGWSTDRTEAITIRADRALLGLATEPRTFDVALQQANLELQVHVYSRPRRTWPFCTDVIVREPTDSEGTWTAIRGTVTIDLSPPGVRARAPSEYRATIRIVGAEFVNVAGVRVNQVQPITLTAIVGGM
jgi:hypothetical protein